MLIGMFVSDLTVALVVALFMIATMAIGLFMARRIRTQNSFRSLLQIANQQLHEANEEMVALNEELRASNEEYQSMNDQLIVLNTRLEEANKTIAAQKDELLNHVLDSTSNIAWSESLIGLGDRYISRSIERVTGFPYQEFVDNPARWSELIIDADRQIEQNAIADIQQNDFAEAEYRIQTRNGATKWMRVQYRIIRDAQGNPIRNESFASDISSIRKAQQDLIAERNLLKSIVENIPDPIVVKSKDGQPVLVNGAQMILSEKIGAALPQIQGDENVMISGVARFNKENLVCLPHGKQLVYLTTSVPLIDENGGSVGMVAISRDVTSARQQEKAISEYRAYLDIIFTHTLEEILLLDLDGRVLLFNNAFARFIETVSGKKPTIGSYLWETTVEERTEVAKSLFKKALEGKASVVDALIQTANGDIIHQLHYQPVTINGRVQFVTIISKDITDYKRNESMMRQSEANMRTLFDHTEKLSLVASHTTNAVMIMDVEGKIEWINRSFTTLTGYKPEDIYGSKIDVLYGPESDQFTIKKIAEHIRGQKDISAELVHYKKSGEKFWLKVSITPVFNSDGSLKNFISVQSDISELKDFENSITSIARELASLIENANVPIFGVDAIGNINEWNQVCSDITGYAKNEVMSASVLDKLFDTSVRGNFTRMITDVLSGKSVAASELTVITRNKKRLNLLVSASPRRAVGNTVTGVLFVAQNITELTEYRQNLERIVNERTRELNEALSKERELVDMKSRFVSIASHEFRTPLSTISVATGILLKHKDKLTGEEVTSKLKNIEKQVEHMTYMLDDVLLVEKSNSGKLTVQRKLIEVLPFFTSLASEVERSTGGSHHIVVQNNLLLPTMMSDEKLLRSIAINLLTNAIKFSPGTHRVDLTLSTDADDFVLKVKDFGIGIPEPDIKNLFEPFFRGGNVSTIQGTGLGLSIIKKSLDLLHGTIKVKSKLGEGTEITIAIPLQDE